jgi:hypothetical protein
MTTAGRVDLDGGLLAVCPIFIVLIHAWRRDNRGFQHNVVVRSLDF